MRRAHEVQRTAVTDDGPPWTTDCLGRRKPARSPQFPGVFGGSPINRQSIQVATSFHPFRWIQWRGFRSIRLGTDEGVLHAAKVLALGGGPRSSCPDDVMGHAACDRTSAGFQHTEWRVADLWRRFEKHPLFAARPDQRR